jgi:hypothetical protein
MKKSIALVAMCATAFSPILTTAAHAALIELPSADPLSEATLAKMQTACNLIAAGYPGPNKWSAVAQPTGDANLVEGPTERAGTRTNLTNVMLVGVSYSNFSITDGPYRVGGSVNMFGDLTASNKSWTGSTFDYEAIADSVFAFGYGCDIYRANYNEPETKPGGFYTNPQPNGLGDCQGIRPSNPNWGDDIGACIFTPSGPPVPVGPGTYDDPVFVSTVAGGTEDQDQDDLLAGHEDNGPGGSATGIFPQGQTVICISPSTTTKKGVPGAWVAKNYYDGGDLNGTGTGCNTTTFINATYKSGSETSQGTYISVPDYAALTTP